MKRITVAVDGSDLSFRALDFILPMAKALGAQVETISVGQEESFQRLFLQIREMARMSEVPVQCQVVPGRSVAAVLDYLAVNKSDLLVIGPMKHGGVVGTLTQSACLQIVREAPCPVLVAR